MDVELAREVQLLSPIDQLEEQGLTPTRDVEQNVPPTADRDVLPVEVLILDA